MLAGAVVLKPDVLSLSVFTGRPCVCMSACAFVSMGFAAVTLGSSFVLSWPQELSGMEQRVPYSQMGQDFGSQYSQRTGKVPTHKHHTPRLHAGPMSTGALTWIEK